MKRLYFIILSSLIGLVIFGFIFPGRDKIAQAQFDPDQFGNIHGFIWADTVGLISANCNNDFDNNGVIEEAESQCPVRSYGLTVSNDMTLTGFAWSENIGWICFGASCGIEQTPPGEPLGAGDENKTWIDVTDGKIYGWARIQNLEPQNGWLSLRGINQENENFGIEVNTDGNFSGFGWHRDPNQVGFGWFDFQNITTNFSFEQECDEEGSILPCGGDVGECQSGERVCQRQGDGSLKWSECQNEVGPMSEICDGKDNNCDGAIDNDIDCQGTPFPCSEGETMACGAGLCQGEQTCSGGIWSACQAPFPEQEICDGIDNNCNGLIDELDICRFQVKSPQGIYEPLCCLNGEPQNGQCLDNSYPVFCDGPDIIKGKKLVGTHLHAFKIKISGAQASDGTDIACQINRNDIKLFDLLGEINDGKAELSYILKEEDLDSIAGVPWLIKECKLGETVPQTVNLPIFVHGNYWTELSQADQDMYKAYDCWLGQGGRYFANDVRCHFEGDFAFVRSMARGVPIEGDCSDGEDNDGNGLIDCDDRWCQGIAYECLPLCPPGGKSTKENPCKERIR